MPTAPTYAPEVLSVRRVNGVAGEFRLIADVRYPGADRETTVFQGSVYGSPGPVLVFIPGLSDWIRVSDPERCGDTLNEAWVRNYFA